MALARSTGCKEGNCENGFGKWVYTDKTTYEGEWVQTQKHGQGTETWPNGYIYKGEFKNSAWSGQGKLTFPNGATYEGEWENGFMNESKRMSHGLSKDVTTWLEKAVDAYWHDRAYAILKQVGTAPEIRSLRDWNQLLEDMYGTDENRKLQLLDVALNDINISENAKEWLKKNYA